MKYKLIVLLLFLTSCAQNYSSLDLKKSFNSKGFAYIYNDEDFLNQVIKKKLDNNLLQIAHNKLRPGSLIKIINTKTNDSIILKNDKRFEYPEFYKILITKPVAEKINLQLDLPLVEIIEVKKNKSFVAKKTKIFKEEEKIHSNAPIESVTINNISKNIKKKNKTIKDKFYIIIAEFYSKDSAAKLKQRITQELLNFDKDYSFIEFKSILEKYNDKKPYPEIN